MGCPRCRRKHHCYFKPGDLHTSISALKTQPLAGAPAKDTADGDATPKRMCRMFVIIRAGGWVVSTSAPGPVPTQSRLYQSTPHFLVPGCSAVLGDLCFCREIRARRRMSFAMHRVNRNTLLLLPPSPEDSTQILQQRRQSPAAFGTSEFALVKFLLPSGTAALSQCAGQADPLHSKQAFLLKAGTHSRLPTLRGLTR